MKSNVHALSKDTNHLTIDGQIRTQNSSAVPSVYVKLTDTLTREAQTALRSLVPHVVLLIPHVVLLIPPGPQNAPSWFNSIDKKAFVKADLAIYCLVLGVSG